MTSLCEIELRLGEEAAEGARQKEEWSDWEERVSIRKEERRRRGDVRHGESSGGGFDV